MTETFGVEPWSASTTIYLLYGFFENRIYKKFDIINNIIIKPALGEFSKNTYITKISNIDSSLFNDNIIQEYIEDNYDAIEKDMNSRNSTSKRKELIVENSNCKTRKKREELSVSATKSIKKEKVEIIVNFN